MNKTENILSLDLGTNLGWATLIDGKIDSGTEYLSAKKNIRFENIYTRFKRFKLFLERKNKGITYIVYEMVQQRQPSVAADQIYGAFLAYLMEHTQDHAIPAIGVAVSTIKKHITGKGGASKDKVVECVENKFYKKVSTHDEADALALLDYAMTNNIFKIGK